MRSSLPLYCAASFVNDLAGRLASRVQLTTDGHRAYLDAIDGAFGGQVDYAMLLKRYGVDPEAEKRHSPALHFMHYNFARLDQTIRSTPAMKAGVTDHLWSIEEIVLLLEAKEEHSN